MLLQETRDARVTFGGDAGREEGLAAVDAAETRWEARSQPYAQHQHQHQQHYLSPQQQQQQQHQQHQQQQHGHSHPQSMSQAWAAPPSSRAHGATAAGILASASASASSAAPDDFGRIVGAAMQDLTYYKQECQRKV